MGPVTSMVGVWQTDGTMRPLEARWIPSGYPAALLFVLHIQGAVERAETDHAAADQVCMARDVATMFDELKALAGCHAELHADQARLQAELDQTRAELARARRPWWRRWMGR